MADLEERLRTAVTRRSERFEPSPDLPERIDARVRRRRRTRQLMTGGLAAAAAAAAVLVVVLVGPGGQDEGSIRMTGRDAEDVQNPPERSSSTSTTDVERSTSSSPSSTTSSSLPSGPPTGGGIDPLTSLTRQGVGPITAGMTLREAQDAAGVPITLSYTGSSTCNEAHVDGLQATGLVLVVEPAPSGADPMDGIVRAAAGSVLPSAEGVMVGQSRDEVLGILGQPTRTEGASGDIGGELLVFEAGGYAYGVITLDGMVYDVQSGDPGWLGDIDGCPGSGPG